MTYDIQTIKERISLLELFTRDGYPARRSGSSFIASCPFHVEKTPSCQVDDRRFHCFGCGAGSDVFDYWERSRGASKTDAIAALASIAGISPEAGYKPATNRPTPTARKEPQEVKPLTPSELAAWFACVDTLRSSPSEISRIASWRGFRESTVHWAIARGIIGLKSWQGIPREAFLVEMPVSPESPLVAVSTHIRLAPHTKGNDHRKASWRFHPSGCGAWPLVFGTPATAKTIFFLEGQWDALALIDLMGWGEAAIWPPTLALVAMRGATSFRKLIESYAINPNAIGFAIADADAAGSGWFAADGFISLLNPKLRTLFAFWPGTPGADLNDLLIAGLTRSSLIAVIRPKMPQKRFAKPSGPTFRKWCNNHLQHPELGHAARFVSADPFRPAPRARAAIWLRHWEALKPPPDTHKALIAAWDTFTDAACTTTA